MLNTRVRRRHGKHCVRAIHPYSSGQALAELVLASAGSSPGVATNYTLPSARPIRPVLAAGESPGRGAVGNPQHLSACLYPAQVIRPQLSSWCADGFSIPSLASIKRPVELRWNFSHLTPCDVPVHPPSMSVLSCRTHTDISDVSWRKSINIGRPNELLGTLFKSPRKSPGHTRTRVRCNKASNVNVQTTRLATHVYVSLVMSTYALSPGDPPRREGFISHTTLKKALSPTSDGNTKPCET